MNIQLQGKKISPDELNTPGTDAGVKSSVPNRNGSYSHLMHISPTIYNAKMADKTPK